MTHDKDLIPCEMWADKIADFYSHNLSPSEQEAFEAHLETCQAACKAVISEYKWMDEKIHLALSKKPLPIFTAEQLSPPATLPKRALLVGINKYDYLRQLNGCVDDARAMQQMLELHEDRSENFSCHTLLGEVSLQEAAKLSLLQQRVTLARLKKELQSLFDFEGMVLFYFSGHGYENEHGVYLVTQDAKPSMPGLLFNDLLIMANHAQAREVVLIIDSCSSGALGEPNKIEEPDRFRELENLYLRSGVTLLTASRSGQAALEINGHGVFTHLVLGALKGGASDVRGQISAAAIYAYAEQALGPWDQRPIYRSNASQFSTIRRCTPDVKDEELNLLPRYFPTPDFHYQMDTTYEATCPDFIPEHVAIFRLFKHFQVARLLRPTSDTDLYFAAIHSHTVELTPLGQFYWQLASTHCLGNTPKATISTNQSLKPTSEWIAELFAEIHERGASEFSYETARSCTKAREIRQRLINIW